MITVPLAHELVGKIVATWYDIVTETITDDKTDYTVKKELQYNIEFDNYRVTRDQNPILITNSLGEAVNLYNQIGINRI